METDQQSALGRKISRQRRAVFLTQQALGKLVGVDQSAVARWEKGETVPALRHRRGLAEALMISPSILFEDEAA